MRNTSKKILGIISAIALSTTAFSFASCSEKFEMSTLTGYVSEAEVESNGGFAVRKGDYVYFINGAADYTADNTYGSVVKGSLMRISTAKLAEEDYSAAEVVVPSLFAAQNFESGIYIYGDYVYYATPTRDKNLKGEVENTWIDFKRAKLDGSEVMEDPYFRLDSNTTKFRFVQVDGVDRNSDGEKDVFCLYEDTNDAGTAQLKSFNTATNEDVVLVSGAKSAFFYDQKNPENPNVYYTMGVKYNVGSDQALDATYDQVYTVNAAARATVNADNASYSVENGKTYSFDKAWMEEQNKDAKKNDSDEPYNFKDYSTYPYVNLGSLVLDGVGSRSGESIFNGGDKADAVALQGFTYTIQRYENGGVYFTRANEDNSDTKLYYMTEDRGSEWNSIKANDFKNNAKVDVVANDTTNASATALFEVEEKDGARVHTYVYVSGSTLKRTQSSKDGEKSLEIVRNLTSTTLWKTVGDYVYYYGTGVNGNNLCRINYKGNPEYKMGDATVDVYNPLYAKTESLKEYREVVVSLIDWNSAWYKPELFSVGENATSVLYSNAQSYGAGATAYNYVYATKIGTAAEIEARNESYKTVSDYLAEYSNNTNAQGLINYYFRADVTKLPIAEETIALYDGELFEEITKKFSEELPKETKFISLLGKMTDEDVEAIDTAWTDSLLQVEEEVEEEDEFPTWAIWTIVGCSVAAVAIIVAIPVIMAQKKKAAKKREEEATVNAYKRKRIVTTDDKSIDVYADEKKAEEEVSENNE